MTILTHYNRRQKVAKEDRIDIDTHQAAWQCDSRDHSWHLSLHKLWKWSFWLCYVWNMSEIWKNISERREVEQGKTCFDRKTRIMNKKQCTERMTSEQELVGIKQWTLFVCTVVLLAAWESIKIGKWDICKINSDWGSAPPVGWFGIKLLSSPGTIMTG